MSASRTVVSFKGCRTRSEFFARLTAFLDGREDALVRDFAARLLMDSDVDTEEEFQSQITQLKAYLATTRADTRAEAFAVVNRALDEGGCP